MTIGGKCRGMVTNITVPIHLETTHRVVTSQRAFRTSSKLTTYQSLEHFSPISEHSFKGELRGKSTERYENKERKVNMR